ncbi:MAG: hypothetical protein ACRDOE_16320, partial [Streptosporangiaceae bacterium]
IAALEAKKTPPSAFVKANVPARAKAERQKRAPEHNQARGARHRRRSSRTASRGARSVRAT